MDEKELYRVIKSILERGNNVEVKMTKDKEIVVYEVQKKKIKCPK